jgi:DNA-binding PadR family transcriptional regulator
LTIDVDLCRLTTEVDEMKNKKEPRLTLQGMKVLRTFVDSHDADIAGADIQRLTGLSSGTLYPLLFRFEQAGWLSSRWEQVDPSEVGRPRRRLYRIVPNGLAKANEVLGMFTQGVLA